MEPSKLREYTGAYTWEDGGFLYCQLWSELTGADQLVAFDENGEARALYATSPDSFFAGPAVGLATPIESRVEFRRDATGQVTSLMWQKGGARPRIARRTDTERSEDVRFSSGDAQLTGTLLRPNTTARVPAVILVHGSGAEDREYVLPLARFLVRRGVAVLGYDKRGVGGSTADWRTASFDDLASDVIAAHHYLQTRRDIDREHIGVLGWSQAGWIMPIAATRATGIAFIVSVSGAGVPAAETTIDQARNEMTARGMKPETVAEIVALMELQYRFARTGQGWDEYASARQKLVARLGRAPDTFPATRDDPYWESIRRLYFYDPAPVLRQLQVPTLAIFGELDNNIVAEKNRAAWDRALRAAGNKDYALHVVPRANHLMLEAKVGSNAEMPSLQRFVPAYSRLVVEWLATRIPGVGLFRADARTPVTSKEAAMSSAFRRSLPARPDLGQHKKLAKELLHAFRTGDREAIARMRAELPDKTELSLADAQFVLAREYGFSSWRELKDRIEKHVAAQRPPIERFKRAVRDGDAKTVRALLEQHEEVRSSVDAPIFGFDSPALVAVSDKHVDVIDVLLDFGADPNRRSGWWAGGFHPLHGATGAAAERLIAAGAVPDACAAASLDRPDLLSAMLADDPARVHERGGDGKTPLHFARSRRVVDLLLAAGADPDARDVDHRSTPAQWMLGDDPDSSRLELARYLVDRGASADIFLAAALGLTERARTMLESDRSLLQLRTSQGEYGEKAPSSFHIYQWTIGPNLSPLQVAAKFRQHETLAVMERFASPEERLLLACHRGDVDTARAIVAGHPGIVERLGPVDRRALTDEAWAANAPAVELMLALGFDPSMPSASGPTGGNALHCAAWQGSVDCVAAILRRPAGRALLDVREPTYGGTPLSWCSHGSVNCGNPEGDHAAVARTLLAAGARVSPKMGDWEGSDAFQAVIDEALRGS